MNNLWSAEDGQTAIRRMSWPKKISACFHCPTGAYTFWLSDRDGYQKEELDDTMATAILNMHAMEWLAVQYEDISVVYCNNVVRVSFDRTTDGVEYEFEDNTLAEALIQAVLKESSNE